MSSPFRLGVVLGLSIGVVNLLHTMLWPSAEDTAAAVLTFYGAVFWVWALSGFLGARSTGSFFMEPRGALRTFGRFSNMNDREPL